MRIVLFVVACLAPWGARVWAESVLLTGATIHVGDGREITGKQLLILDGKIEAIETSIKLKPDRVVRLDGQHLYPGLIAVANPLGLVEIEGVRSTRDMSEVGEFTPEIRSWSAVNPDSELLGVARANGIAYTEVAPQGGIVAGHSAVLALDGWTVEQMLVRGPSGLHVYWPSHSLNYSLLKGDGGSKESGKSLDDQMRERASRVLRLSDFFAESRAIVNGSPVEILDPLYESMRPVIKGGIPVFVHADDVRQIRAAMKWAREFQLKLVICGGRDSWRMASELAEGQIPVVFEHVFTLPPRETDPYDVHYRAPAILTKAGVKIVIGVGGRFEAAGLRNLPYAASQAVAFGLDPVEAIKALTLHPAEVLGIADRAGTIEPGKSATFFSCDGTPLDIRSNPERMWIRGSEVSLSSRHTRLYERYKSRPKLK